MKTKISYFFLGTVFLLTACSAGDEKTPEEWSSEICTCVSEKGLDAQECQDKLKELKDYYSEDDYRKHDKATTLIGQDCPEVLFVEE